MSGKKPSKSVDLSHLADDKLSKGKQKTLDKFAQMKGPSHKAKQEEQRENKKEAQRRLNRAQDKVHWKKKAGAVCAVVFLCGVGIVQFVSTVLGFVRGSGVVAVDISDTSQLKAVLFSGEPWLVYCVNNETKSQRLPGVLEDSARTLSSNIGLRTAVLPCWDQTESGRSVAQRFKLPKAPPLSFVVANGNKPRILNLVGISKVEELEKRAKPALAIETYRIDSLKKWSSLCTSRRTCVVVGHKQTAQRDAALNVLRPLLEQHRAAKVVTLDTSFWQLKLDEKVLVTRAKGQGHGKRAEVLCLAREEGGPASDGNVTHSGTFLKELDARSATDFLKACESRNGLVQLEKLPRINARPTKPKKVSRPASPSPSPRPVPTPPASKPRDAARGNVDRVGSRERMESQEPLFEAVEEEDEEGEEVDMAEGGDESDGSDEGEDGGDEVEL